MALDINNTPLKHKFGVSRFNDKKKVGMIFYRGEIPRGNLVIYATKDGYYRLIYNLETRDFLELEGKKVFFIENNKAYPINTGTGSSLDLNAFAA